MINKKKLIISLVIILGLGLLGLASYFGYSYWRSSKVVAKVGDQIVTRQVYDQYLDKYKKFFEFNNDQESLNNLETKVLDKLIEDMIVKSEAKRLGVLASQQEIEEEYQKILAEYEDEEVYKATIKDLYNWTVEDTKQNLEVQILKRKLEPKILKGRWGREVTVQYLAGGGEEEGYEAKYQANAEKLVKEMQILLQEKGFEELYKKALSPKSFWPNYDNVIVATPFHWGPHESDIPPEDLEVVFQAKEGEITSLIKSSGGYYAFYKIDKVGEGNYEQWEDFIQDYRHKYVKVYKVTYLIKSFLASVSKLAWADCSSGTGCKGAKVEGKITDANTGSPIKGATVQTSAKNYSNGSSGRQCSECKSGVHGWAGPKSGSTKTDSKGKYSLGGVNGCSCFINCGWNRGSGWLLEVSKNGYKTSNYEYTPSNGQKLTINLALTPKSTSSKKTTKKTTPQTTPPTTLPAHSLICLKIHYSPENPQIGEKVTFWPELLHTGNHSPSYTYKWKVDGTEIQDNDNDGKISYTFTTVGTKKIEVTVTCQGGGQPPTVNCSMTTSITPTWAPFWREVSP